MEVVVVEVEEEDDDSNNYDSDNTDNDNDNNTTSNVSSVISIVGNNMYVSSGRGNNVYNHERNAYFRKLVLKYQLEYKKSPKQQKRTFTNIIVDDIKTRNLPGRFIRQDKDTKLWWNI
mmetsp:Transcript_41722/g.42540  ORF Transcript_41722/g.42540 Transcript_41722/m.42540 type:complete len:118 (+) Transcript_41722:161-514(+)